MHTSSWRRVPGTRSSAQPEAALNGERKPCQMWDPAVPLTASTAAPGAHKPPRLARPEHGQLRGTHTQQEPGWRVPGETQCRPLRALRSGGTRVTLAAAWGLLEEVERVVAEDVAGTRREHSLGERTDGAWLLR